MRNWGRGESGKTLVVSRNRERRQRWSCQEKCFRELVEIAFSPLSLYGALDKVDVSIWMRIAAASVSVP